MHTGRNRMKLAIASTVALLLLFAAQTPASAASAEALVQASRPTADQGLVDKTHWRGRGYRGWGGFYGYRPWGYYGYGYYPPVYGYYYRPYPYWGGGWGWRHRHWRRW
jgi:hypothetical protein